MPKKKRLDQMLVDRGLVESRTRAQALVMAGLVFSGEQKLAKPGQQLAEDAPLEVRGRDHPWVSRGGIKLAHAIEHFDLDPSGVTAMDIGSSTGGFTDVLLQGGAEHVFAVDSGTNQLAWKLRQDERVTVLEQTSARILTPAMIDRPVTWVVCDASFIGLAKVLERPLELAGRECRLVALIKPQFEVGREEVGKKGVVSDPVLHQRVCDEVRTWIEGLGFAVQGIVESPIKGPEGNVEFLISAQRS
ncbi:TlyA family RNA methyltransferase [Erythrobacter sp. AP23]|uniref:TlyA family RNA methyltransferase n=1 Tax=Erythrobacter sp. AP23 TaxID=499656 RepID=UPI00076CD47B|nr:TlyA family RNA methyltransferase [Erythrobacter sp. AP23]KWV96430.1 RNA methyltransferase [Erythrobacter sp. AP23]